MSYYDRGGRGGGGRDNWRRDDRGSSSSGRHQGGSYDNRDYGSRDQQYGGSYDNRDYGSRDQQYGHSGGSYSQESNMPSHGQRRDRPPPHLTGREKEERGRERNEFHYQGDQYQDDLASRGRGSNFEHFGAGDRHSFHQGSSSSQNFGNNLSRYAEQQPRDQTSLEGYYQSQGYGERGPSDHFNRQNEPQRFDRASESQRFDDHGPPYPSRNEGRDTERYGASGSERIPQDTRYEPGVQAQTHSTFQQNSQSSAPPQSVGQKRSHSPATDSVPAKKPTMIAPGKNNRIRVFIKNLPMDYPREEIPKYFKKIGFKAIKVNRYQPLQVFVLQLAPSPNIMDIFDVTKVNDISVEVVDPLTMEEQAPRYLSKARYQRQKVD